MTKNVTDRILLKAIHDHYYQEFCSYDEIKPSRSSKIYVPIDCRAIGKLVNLDPELVFGRLYYHLNGKHGYRQEDGSLVHLFTKKVGNDSDAVNFPLLSAVLAELEQSYYRFTIPIVLSIIALLLSIASFISVSA